MDEDGQANHPDLLPYCLRGQCYVKVRLTDNVLFWVVFLNLTNGGTHEWTDG